MPNKWITFVKEWSAKNNMSYGCALSNSTMKTDYYKKHPNKKSNKAKEVQDTMGMSAEDKDAPAKPKKMKKKLVLKQEVKSTPKKAEPEPEPAVKKISAAKKVIDNFDLLKKIKEFTRVPVDIDDDNDLQRLVQDYKALSTIDILLSDQKKPYKAVAKHIAEQLNDLNHNKYKKYAYMTDEEQEKMYKYEEDLDFPNYELIETADEYGITLVIDGEVASAKLQKPKDVAPKWLVKFMRKEEKK